MKDIYLCWIDDIQEFILSYKGRIDILEKDHNVKFQIDEHYNTRNLDSIARAIDNDLIFFVDYNLKSADGAGIDGDELIKMIRNHNQDCHVVFYSSNATQQELRSLIGDLPKIICVLRENLHEVLVKVANGEIYNI